MLNRQSQKSQAIKIIMNPLAGSTHLFSQQCVPHYLESRQYEYEWLNIGDLKQFAQTVTTHQILLIIGGDGTLHAIINAIGYQNLHKFTFGIIPTGTGNDFARSLEIPMEIEKALETIIEGNVRQADLGVLNHRICFTCAVSLGFGPEVTKNTKRPMRILLGRHALYLGALCYLFRPRPIYALKTRINTQKARWIKTPHLVIGNAKYHGGGFPISPTASLESGLLDLYYLKPVKWFHIPKLFFKVFFKKNHTDFQEVVYQQIHSLHLNLPAPIDVDVDGDIYTFYKTLHLEVYPGCLNVFAPKTQRNSLLQDKLIQNPTWDIVGGNSRAS